MLSKLKYFSKKKSGFTLLEVVGAIFILIIGVVGIANLASNFFSYSRFLASKTTAAYLTQEGLEIVRNIRDSNWVEGNNWDSGLFPCGSDNCAELEADYNDYVLTHSSGSERFLNIDGNGLFSYEAGERTDFKRRIHTFQHPTRGFIGVCVETTWERGGTLHKVRACEKLFNWYGG